MAIKNSSDTNGNRTRDLGACNQLRHRIDANNASEFQQDGRGWTPYRGSSATGRNVQYRIYIFARAWLSI